MEGCLAVDAVNSLQASTDEQDFRLPFTARGKLYPLELILWEKLHSSCTRVCSVDQHLSGLPDTSSILELFKAHTWLGVEGCPFLFQTLYNEI